MLKYLLTLCKIGVTCSIVLFSETLLAAIAFNPLGMTSYQNYSPVVLENLIVKQLSDHKYKETLTLIESQLSKNPNNVDLMLYKASTYAELEQYSKARDVISQIAAIAPHHKKLDKLRDYVAEKLKAQPHNEIGFSQDEAYVSDLKSFWSYSSLHYYRFLDAGTFGGRVNYANRFGINGEQYQLEAYPKISQVGYADLMFAYSNTSQRVFPLYQYRIEPYVSLPNHFEGSIGQYYLRSFDTNIYTYTGSIANRIGNNFVWFRPYHYTPESANYFEAGLRHYYSDDNTYISIKGGAGKIPDIGDVPPFNQIVIYKAASIGVNGQVPLNKITFLRLGLNYVHQKYTTGLLRQITDGSLELIWRF